jgi:calcineurin-like phosphoesterase family protein
MVRNETWYTADLHLGHRLVAELRGFDTPDAHDGELAARWDDTVGDTDVVWVLGDISGGGRGSQQRGLAWIAQRPGVKHLIAGNHDSVHPMHTDAHKALPSYLEVFTSVAQSARRSLAGHKVLLSHFPYLDSADAGDTHHRYDQWRLPQLEAWLLHGHTHSSTRLGDHTIHVGLDAWDLTAVSINVIAQMLGTPA